MGLPFVIENDARMALLGECYAGAAQGETDVVMVTLGTGIGGGLLVEGRVIRGSIGAAAELGHMVIAEDGLPCPGACPNHGCLEAYVSGTALGRETLRRPSSVLGPRSSVLGSPISRSPRRAGCSWR